MHDFIAFRLLPAVFVLMGIVAIDRPNNFVRKIVLGLLNHLGIYL